MALLALKCGKLTFSQFFVKNVEFDDRREMITINIYELFVALY